MFFFIVRQMRFHLGNELPRIPACYPNFLVRTNMFVDKKINGIPATGGSVQTLLLENGTAHWISHLY